MMRSLAQDSQVVETFSSLSIEKFISKVQSYKKLRILGSAALSLAQVAAGRFDVYEEDDIYIWDVQQLV